MNKKTPFSHPIFLLSLFSFLIFSIFYFLAIRRNNQIHDGYESLRRSGFRGFATIKEFHTSERKGTRNYIYTYTTSDDVGRLTDLIEYVDVQTHKKLRIGDTVEVERKSIEVLGKKILIARILGNSNPIPDGKLLELFGTSGIGFSFFLLLISIIVWKYEDKS